jgi:DNA repair exonuclease SbcCD ATPase subunit
VEENQEAAAALDTEIQGKEQAAAELDEQAAKKQKRLEALDKKTNLAKKEAATIAEFDAIGKPVLLGGYNVSAADLKKLKSLAKEAVKSHGIIAELKKQIADFVNKVKELTQKLMGYEGGGITDHIRYIQAG